jgi:hypothetical protein
MDVGIILILNLTKEIIYGVRFGKILQDISSATNPLQQK